VKRSRFALALGAVVVVATSAVVIAAHPAYAAVTFSSTAVDGVSIATTNPGGGRVITVTLSGTQPGGPVLISLPVFFGSTVASVSNGTYNASTHTVTANQSATTITITLNN